MRKASAAGSLAMTGRMSLNRPLLESSAAVMSIGFVVVAKLGRIFAETVARLGASFAIGMPAFDAASAASTQIAPELLIATRRRPCGFQPFR